MNGSSNGSINGIFASLEGCNLICKGFTLEEGIEYIVTEKKVNGKTYYRPCVKTYAKSFAELYGYKPVPQVELDLLEVKKEFPLYHTTHEVIRTDETIIGVLIDEGYQVIEEEEVCYKDGKKYYWEKLASSDVVDIDFYELYELER